MRNTRPPFHNNIRTSMTMRIIRKHGWTDSGSTTYGMQPNEVARMAKTKTATYG